MSKKKDIVQKRVSLLIASGVLTTVFGLITVVALVNNSREAKRRYDALIAVDAAGGDVEAALGSLREYIYAHMNTSIGSPTGVYPPIQLKGTYDRLVAVEQAKLAGDNTLYDEAVRYCESRFGAGQIQQRANCASEYITARGGGAIQQVSIPDGLYKFDFVSPKWSPDLAGFALIATIASGLSLVINAAILWHYRSIVRKSL